MKHISDEKLLQHISNAVSQITPEQADALWKEPVTPADGSEWYLDTNAAFQKKTGKRSYFTGAVAACFLFCLVSVFMFQIMPSASVYLDVNPSIRLKVNYLDHVTEASACNQDAEEILEDLDLRGTDLNVALYAILGSMVHQGYLTEHKDTVLVSVHSANTGRADELQDLVSSLIEEDLNTMIRSGDVLTHRIEEEEIHDLEEDSANTPGKSLFVDNLLKQYPQLSSYPLDTMTMDEIISLLDEKDLDYSDYKEAEEEDTEESEDFYEDIEDEDDDEDANDADDADDADEDENEDENEEDDEDEDD